MMGHQQSGAKLHSKKYLLARNSLYEASYKVFAGNEYSMTASKSITLTMRARLIFRQGAYQTPTFGDRFVKVSTSVPKPWIEEFVELLRAMMQRARGLDASGPLF
jgi:hypothetical protein